MPMLSLSHRTTAPAIATEPLRGDILDTLFTALYVQLEIPNQIEYTPLEHSGPAGFSPVCRPLW